MIDLDIGKTVDGNGIGIFEPEEVIGRNSEKLGDFDQHLDGGKNIIVFPIRNALLTDVQVLCKFHLAQMSHRS